MKIKIGVIGAGMAWEKLHYPAVSELSDRFEIGAVCDRTKADAQAFATKFNLPDGDVYDHHMALLARDDITAVLVAVPIPDNFNVAADVLVAKKHLIAEKPLAATIDGAEKLVEMAKKAGVEVLVAENYRFNEENMFIKNALKENRIGEVIYFISNNIFDFEEDMKGSSFAAKEWRQHPDYKGGSFLDGGIHDVAQMRYLFGNVKSIYATGKESNKDYCPYLSVNVHLQFENGVTGQYCYCPNGKETVQPRVGLRIFGTGGEIYLESKQKGSFDIVLKDGAKQTVNFTPDRGYYNEWAHFYNVLSKGEQSRCSPSLELDDLKTVMDALHSIENGKVVMID